MKLKRAARATLIAFDGPALQDNARFVQIAEEFRGSGIHREACRESSRYAHSPTGLDAKRLNLGPSASRASKRR